MVSGLIREIPPANFNQISWGASGGCRPSIQRSDSGGSTSWRRRWRATSLQAPRPEDRRRYDFERTVGRFRRSSLELMAGGGWEAGGSSGNTQGALGNIFKCLRGNGEVW
ncbi:hypothetical protein M5K25_018048 [Dendrobium thyrsiflorum]|uniref:Uncharacterized protein n=1 Tax=Dendrobium thyrsiflorum TaxID=117978 RepID=A0ABD0UHM5_DENTH